MNEKRTEDITQDEQETEINVDAGKAYKEAADGFEVDKNVGASTGNSKKKRRKRKKMYSVSADADKSEVADETRGDEMKVQFPEKGGCDVFSI